MRTYSSARTYGRNIYIVLLQLPSSWRLRRQHGNHHCEGLVLFMSLSLLGELCCAVVAVRLQKLLR